MCDIVSLNISPIIGHGCYRVVYHNMLLWMEHYIEGEYYITLLTKWWMVIMCPYRANCLNTLLLPDNVQSLNICALFPIIFITSNTVTTNKNANSPNTWYLLPTIQYIPGIQYIDIIHTSYMETNIQISSLDFHK